MENAEAQRQGGCGIHGVVTPISDKQSTLLSKFIFSMQHGMLWVGNPVLPEQNKGVPYDEAANRFGSWSWMMRRQVMGAAADSFVSGDNKTAVMMLKLKSGGVRSAQSSALLLLGSA
nr:hypothetical protein [Rhizobacter sp. Root404]